MIVTHGPGLYRSVVDVVANGSGGIAMMGPVRTPSSSAVGNTFGTHAPLSAKLRRGLSPNGCRTPSIPFAATVFPPTCRTTSLSRPPSLRRMSAGEGARRVSSHPTLCCSASRGTAPRLGANSPRRRPFKACHAASRWIEGPPRCLSAGASRGGECVGGGIHNR